MPLPLSCHALAGAALRFSVSERDTPFLLGTKMAIQWLGGSDSELCVFHLVGGLDFFYFPTYLKPPTSMCIYTPSEMRSDSELPRVPNDARSTKCAALRP